MTNDEAPIMVVDDDEDVREVVKMIVEASGRRVITASDGLEAWREISLGTRPAVILLDLMMPHMDGEHFLHTLRASSTSYIPVVIMSGHSSARERARQLHADDCLTKPFDLDELLSTVDRFAPAEPSLGSPSSQSPTP
jgi:CheY-like chemotaxis protein